MKRIPCLVVSGYLGSGKTTLVRRLLGAAAAAGRRASYVSNEFGELGVDAAALGESDGFVEIAGGCICCALNDQLYQTLLRLRDRLDPDAIIVETSGLAVPSEVQLTFYQPPICDWVAEESVVTVVSAEQLADGAEVEGVFREQIETADLVLLNKADLVPPERLPDLEAAIHAMNPGVPVVRTVHCDLDLRVVYAGTSRDPTRSTPAPVDHGEHAHDAYASAVHPVPRLPDEDALRAWLAGLRGPDTLRVKGFARAGGAVFSVQGVGRRLEVVPVQDPVPADILDRIVVIGRRDPRPGAVMERARRTP